MNKEEIKEYLNLTDKLEQKLKRKDKETLQWLIFGYNECAKLLNKRERENKQLKKRLQQKEEVINKAKEYIKNNTKEEYENIEVDEHFGVLLEILDNKGE